MGKKIPGNTEYGEKHPLPPRPDQPFENRNRTALRSIEGERRHIRMKNHPVVTGPQPPDPAPFTPMGGQPVSTIRIGDEPSVPGIRPGIPGRPSQCILSPVNRLKPIMRNISDILKGPRNPRPAENHQYNHGKTKNHCGMMESPGPSRQAQARIPLKRPPAVSAALDPLPPSG